MAGNDKKSVGLSKGGKLVALHLLIWILVVAWATAFARDPVYGELLSEMLRQDSISQPDDSPG